MRQPTLYIPHGGGPCFFMDDPHGHWTSMAGFLRTLPALLPEPPRAILLISAHWETRGFAFTAGAKPSLVFDYFGFPPHTYELRYNAPGAPELAERAAELLQTAGLRATLDDERGFDHGVFVPLKVAFPSADIPVVEMSLDASLDPALHVAAGQALAPLRDEGVLIIGSGMSFHNMRGYGDSEFTGPSAAFDTWLTAAIAQTPSDRAAALANWAQAPAGRLSHPREEHLIPLMVAAGAADGKGRKLWGDLILKTAISAYQFD
jgi:aromatic ring-opening dioxygenase catalytic subunit (LigB family)